MFSTHPSTRLDGYNNLGAAPADADQFAVWDDSASKVVNVTQANIFSAAERAKLSTRQAKTSLTVGITGSGADYECDGSNDSSQINSALTALSVAGGGHIHFGVGDYYPTLIMNIPSNVTLSGCGDSTIIHIATTKYVSIDDKSSVLLKRVKFASSSQAFGDAVVSIKNSNTVYLDKVTVEAIGFGVFIEANDDTVCENVWLNQCVLNGSGLNDIIGGGSATGGSSVVRNLSVTDCYISQDCTTNSYENALAISRAEELLVDGCRFYGRCVMSFEEQPHQYIHIVNNKLRPATTKSDTGIFIATESGATLPSSSIIIDNNIIISGKIQVEGVSTAHAKRIRITNNEIVRSNGSGVLLNYTERIHVETNAISGGSSTGLSGVYIANSTYIKVKDNFISGADYGIRDLSSTTTNRIECNDLTSIGAQGVVSESRVRNNQNYNLPYTSTSSAYTLTKANESGVVELTGSTPRSFTLPTSGNVIGDTYQIIQGGTGTLTVVGTINGATNFVMSAQYESLTVIWTGTEWRIT